MMEIDMLVRIDVSGDDDEFLVIAVMELLQGNIYIHFSRDHRRHKLSQYTDVNNALAFNNPQDALQ